MISLREVELGRSLVGEVISSVGVSLELMVVLREQSAWHGESLDLSPAFEGLIGALESHDVGMFGGGLIQPLERLADIVGVLVFARLLATELFQSLNPLVRHPCPTQADSSHTMEWDEQADLSVLDPLPNAVACAPLDAGDEGAVVDYAVEHLPCRGAGWRECALLGCRALAGTHLGFGGHGWRGRLRRSSCRWWSLQKDEPQRAVAAARRMEQRMQVNERGAPCPSCVCRWCQRQVSHVQMGAIEVISSLRCFVTAAAAAQAEAEQSAAAEAPMAGFEDEVNDGRAADKRRAEW